MLPAATGAAAALAAAMNTDVHTAAANHSREVKLRLFNILSPLFVIGVALGGGGAQPPCNITTDVNKKVKERYRVAPMQKMRQKKGRIFILPSLLSS
jgi:hypothetical protein